MTLVTHDARLSPDQVRGWLAVHEEVVHATIEIHVCGAGELTPAASRGPAHR